MSIRIPRVRCGIKPLEDWCNQIADALEELANREFIFGSNLTGWQDDRAFVLDAQAGNDFASTDATTSTEIFPFDISVQANDSGDDLGATVNVIPGQINNLVAINVLNDLDADSGDLLYVYAHCLTEGRALQSYELKVSTTAPSPQVPTKNSPPETIDVILGIIDYTGPIAPAIVGTYTPYRTFFPKTDVLLTAIEVTRESVNTPIPGTLPYDIYYIWQITGAYAP